MPHSKDPAKARACRQRYRAKTKAWVMGYVAASRCADCGLSGFEWADDLEFHHLDPAQKESNIKRMIGHGCSVDHIRREIEKTVVLCRGCHDKRHVEMGAERVMRAHHADRGKAVA